MKDKYIFPCPDFYLATYQSHCLGCQLRPLRCCRFFAVKCRKFIKMSWSSGNGGAPRTVKTTITCTYFTIMPGRRSKFSLTIFSSSSSDFLLVPNENTVMERGSAIPMAYEIWRRTRRHSLAATKDLAIHLAA